MQVVAKQCPHWGSFDCIALFYLLYATLQVHRLRFLRARREAAACRGLFARDDRRNSHGWWMVDWVNIYSSQSVSQSVWHIILNPRFNRDVATRGDLVLVCACISHFTISILLSIISINNNSSSSETTTITDCRSVGPSQVLDIVFFWIARLEWHSGDTLRAFHSMSSCAAPPAIV